MTFSPSERKRENANHNNLRLFLCSLSSICVISRIRFIFSIVFLKLFFDWESSERSAPRTVVHELIHELICNSRFRHKGLWQQISGLRGLKVDVHFEHTKVPSSPVPSGHFGGSAITEEMRRKKGRRMSIVEWIWGEKNHGLIEPMHTGSSHASLTLLKSLLCTKAASANMSFSTIYLLASYFVRWWKLSKLG